MIEINNLVKKYQETVINDFSFKFLNHGLYTIVGASGSGKSTLLNIISGVDNIYQGNVTINNINLKHLNEEESAKYRLNHLGYMFQDFKLFNLLTVFDNVFFNLEAISKLSKNLKNKMVLEALEFVNLTDKKKKLVNQLSGGEKQRVALARSILTSPEYLLCDEPTGNLDTKNADNVFSLLKEYSKNHTVIVVSHDLERCEKYADVIINLKDGKLENVKTINSLIDNKTKNLKLNYKNKTSLSLSFRLRYGYTKIKEKKWRSLFTIFASSISLLAIGIGLIIVTSLRNQIVNSFSSVIEKNQIIVTKKGNDLSPYTSYVSTSEKTAQEIANEYSYLTYGMGCRYLNNFENLFPDRNQVYLLQNERKIILPSFHADRFNSYVWPNEKTIEKFYPTLQQDLKINQVVLGLTYHDMLMLCNDLSINRDFATLGNYIASHNIRLFLGIDNLSWGYDNDIELELVSVYPSVKSEVYQSNHLFNQYIFEIEGQLPFTLDITSDPKFPWTIKKVYNLHLNEAPFNLIEELQFNVKYNDILIENAENYLHDGCISSDTCDRYEVLLFTLDKNAINISDLINIKRLAPNLSNYYFSTTSGYQMHTSGMIAGFANNIGFSFDEQKAIEIGDFFSKHREGEIDEIKNVAIGGITHFNKNGVLFSSDLSKLTNNEIPKNYNEIIVSAGLVNYLGFKGNPLFENLYYSVYSSSLDDVIINHFKIVGIINEEKNVIYHNPLFSISFFRDKLGVSSFNLIPTNVVLNFDNDINVDLLISSLNNSFKEYKFSSPLTEIGSSVDEVMNYVNIIAIIFSLVAIIISILLLSLISYLNIIESKNEIKLLRLLGHSKQSIKEIMVAYALDIGIVTTIIAIFELLFFQIIMSTFLGKFIGASINLTITIWPFLIVVIFGLTMPQIISAIITNLYLKK